MKKLFILAGILAGTIGLVATLAQKAKAKKEAWRGLSESEARERVERRLPNKIPEDRREHITDTVVTKMRERGVLTGDEFDADEIDLTSESDTSDLATHAP